MKMDNFLKRLSHHIECLRAHPVSNVDGPMASAKFYIGVDYSLPKLKEGVPSQLVPTAFPYPSSESLHLIGEDPNSFERILEILNGVISDINAGNPIVSYRFGDYLTRTEEVRQMGVFADLDEMKRHYKDITPGLIVTYKKSFSPIIEEVIAVTNQSPLECHFLVVLLDWPVMGDPELRATVEAIRRSRSVPLSIVGVTIGEGSVDTMRKFLHYMRSFPNFKLVEYKDILSSEENENEAEFSSKIKKIFNSQIELQCKLIIKNRRIQELQNMVGTQAITQ